jgi:hypothetical protein
MWPFSRRKQISGGSPVSVASAVKQLAAVGIRMRPGITPDGLLNSLGGNMESPVDWTLLLCALGSQAESGDFEWVSDDIWHFDTECIEDHGAYVEVVGRFIALAKGALPMTQLRDHVDVLEGKAWLEFTLDDKTQHWDLVVDEDWVDPELYSRIQQLVVPRGAGRRFIIVALGQDCLIGFGDDHLRQVLLQLTGLQFNWE